MKLLKDILYRAGAIEIHGTVNLAVASISMDSRLVKRDSLFVAVRGTKTDGHNFIDMAVQQGAIAIVCETLPENINEKVTYVVVSDASLALGFIASNFYDNPSEKLIVVGVTGTNGKTTVSTLLYHTFMSLGYKCGLLSTVKNIIGKETLPSTHTTPDAISINHLLNKMVAARCSHVFMEVSSHALDQDRVAGLKFKGAIFTNITHDHLDYHLSFENYFEAKQKLFNSLPSESWALSFSDDPYGTDMVNLTKCHAYFYGIHMPSDFECRIVEKQTNGMLLVIDGHEIWTNLIGDFNAANLLAVYAASCLLEQDKLQVLTALSNLKSVEGRFQYYHSPNNVTAIVDYAHTPDALDNVLRTIGDLRTGNEQVITVVGCGGDRDKSKRPEMAKIAAKWSTKLILTSDNPRSEDPQAIVNDMLAGLDPTLKRKTVVILDRREAIRTACNFSNPGDIILVAGKGHEKYQEILGIKHPFDDAAELQETFKTIGQ
ncbi:MAG: UDP-N-acetylmuramoyl-L-alanyl-D-glutamate--2,6-diaminopimelate ligase [Flavobacteriales bacterium]